MDTPSHLFANGDRMPLIGLGTWKSEPGVVGQAVREAVGLGYRHLDCAPIYGNEAEVGEALSELFGGGIRRDDLWVTSKLWNSKHLPPDVLPALKQTLHDLRLHHLDLYLMHWPVALRPSVHYPASGDDFLPIEQAPLAETWAAMEEAVDAGLVRHLGVSNFHAARVRELAAESRIAPEVNQVEAHPLLAQRGLLETCRELGVLITGYSPLGSPDRPARVRREDDPVLLEIPEILAMAEKYDASPAQVVLAWAVHRGSAVIPKSINPTRMRENLEAAAVPLDADDRNTIDALDRGRRYIDGSTWTMPGSPYTLEWLWGGQDRG